MTLLSSCETEKWAVPTAYEIRDVGADSDAVTEIKEALQKDGNPYGFVEGTTTSVGDGPDVAYRFRLDNVNTVDDLNSVQAIIREITERYNVPVDFASALLTFKSLEGSALTQIIVTGTATRGAIVYLDDGTSELVRVPNVGDDGSWSVAIVTNPALQVRGGWVRRCREGGYPAVFSESDLGSVRFGDRRRRRPAGGFAAAPARGTGSE